MKNVHLKDRIRILENPKTIVPKDIIFSNGKGPIRYLDEGKYYHGIGSDEQRLKWNKNNEWDKSIIQRITEKKLKAVYETHNTSEYCTNCIVHEKLSDRKRVYKVFTCMGHEFRFFFCYYIYI